MASNYYTGALFDILAVAALLPATYTYAACSITLFRYFMPNALIVDDEIDIWFLLSGILRKHNLKTYFVNNLAAATQRLKQDVPAILFLDNHLPDGFGLQFIRFLKKNYPTIKIVLITGYASASDQKQAMTDGADIFLSKPFNRQSIDDALVQLL